MNNKAGLLEPKEEDGPMLPVANPDLDGKYPAKAKPSVPAAVYVV